MSCDYWCPEWTGGDGSGYVTATGTGVRLTVTGRAATGGSSHLMDMVVTKGFSRAAVAADVVGFLGGASAGWLLPGLPFIVLPSATVAAGAAALVTLALSALPTSQTPVDDRARIGA